MSSLLLWCAFGLTLYPRKDWLFGVMTVSVAGGLAVCTLLLASEKFAQLFFSLVSKVAPGKMRSKLATLRTAWEEGKEFGVQSSRLRGCGQNPLVVPEPVPRQIRGNSRPGYMNKARLRGLYRCIIDAPGYQLLMTTPRLRLETSRLRLETSRLRLETSRLRLETSRLRLETSRLRLETSQSGFETGVVLRPLATVHRSL